MVVCPFIDLLMFNISNDSFSTICGKALVPTTGTPIYFSYLLLHVYISALSLSLVVCTLLSSVVSPCSFMFETYVAIEFKISLFNMFINLILLRSFDFVNLSS